MIQSILWMNTQGFEPVIGRLNDEAFPLLALVPQAVLTLDEGTLRHLAWQHDVDVDGMSPAEQRQAVQEAIALHRRRGTVWAIRRALEWRGFRSVAVTEGSTSDLLHNGMWDHDGNETHGGDLQHWSSFRVAAVTGIGFDGRRVVRTISRAKNVRSKLIGVEVRLELAMRFSAVPDAMRFTTEAGVEAVSHTDDGYNIIIDLLPEHDEMEFLSLQGTLSGEVVGEVSFARPLRKGLCAVRVLVSSNILIGFSGDFDDDAAAFDDPFAAFDD